MTLEIESSVTDSDCHLITEDILSAVRSRQTILTSGPILITEARDIVRASDGFDCSSFGDIGPNLRSPLMSVVCSVPSI